MSREQAAERGSGAGADTSDAPRILVVDDERNFARRLAWAFEEAGFRAEACYDGATAMESMRNDPPDLIVLDVRMPGMDGLQCLRTLHAESGRTPPVILLTGDNGYFLGERGYAGKWTMHDRSTRVPFIVCDPRLGAARRGTTVDAFALNLDVAPTLLDLAGVEIPPAVQGRSLGPLLAGEDGPWREQVFTEHLWDFDRIPRTEGLRTRDWKYIRYLDHPEYEELYDLRDDPREEKNLARDEGHARFLLELRERCSLAARRAE